MYHTAIPMNVSYHFSPEKIGRDKETVEAGRRNRTLNSSTSSFCLAVKQVQVLLKFHNHLYQLCTKLSFEFAFLSLTILKSGIFLFSF